MIEKMTPTYLRELADAHDRCGEIADQEELRASADLIEAQATEITKLMFDLGLAHGSIVRLLAHGDTMAIAVDPEVHLSDPNPEWSLAAADAREILAAYIESPTAEEAPNASNRE